MLDFYQSFEFGDSRIVAIDSAHGTTLYNMFLNFRSSFLGGVEFWVEGVEERSERGKNRLGVTFGTGRVLSKGRYLPGFHSLFLVMMTTDPGL